MSNEIELIIGRASDISLKKLGEKCSIFSRFGPSIQKSLLGKIWKDLVPKYSSASFESFVCIFL